VKGNFNEDANGSDGRGGPLGSRQPAGKKAVVFCLRALRRDDVD